MELTQRKIGANIAAFRKGKGLTQEQLASQLGVSAPAVSKWETGNSYPDITLLCPLARALGTNVDTLLQFEETLSDQEVSDQINALIQTALGQGPSSGWEQGEKRLEELLHHYPNCTALQYNAVVTYDMFYLFFPTAGEAVRQRWKDRKRGLLEDMRATGSAAYWQSATIGLASMEIGDGDLEEGAALLKELPEHVGDPTNVWALYYLKKEEPEKALEITQKQLYKLVSQVQNCLVTLMNPKLLSKPDKQLKVCGVYRTVSQAFGLMDMSDGLLLEMYLGLGETRKAVECFARYVDVITGTIVLPDEDLFTPGLSYAHKEGQQATTKELRRLMLKAVTEEEQYRSLFEDPTFVAALEKLKASL